MIRGTGDVTDSRHGGIFISPATENLKKQDKFQPRDKSYLYNITNSEAEPLKDGSAASQFLQTGYHLNLLFLENKTVPSKVVNSCNMTSLPLVNTLDRTVCWSSEVAC